MSATAAWALIVGAHGRHASCIAGQLGVPPANSRAGREPGCAAFASPDRGGAYVANVILIPDADRQKLMTRSR